MTDEAKSSHRLDGETRVVEPVRVQLRRTKGWRKPENTIVVSRPSKWGNPYIVQRRDDYEGLWLVVDVRDDTVEDHRGHKRDALALAAYLFGEELRRELGITRASGTLAFSVADVRRELKDRNLACWCPLPEPGRPDLCHARILLDIAAGADA